MVPALQLKLDEAKAVGEVEARMSDGGGPNRSVSNVQLEVQSAQTVADEEADPHACTTTTLAQLCARASWSGAAVVVCSTYTRLYRPA
jgi:hypothetical protein